MNIIFGKTQRGASEVNCAEAPDQAELISGKGAHRMRHHGNQSRRSHAERHHIRQRIHLDSQIRSCGEYVVAVKLHQKVIVDVKVNVVRA